MKNEPWVYAGFWLRVWATIIDAVLETIVILPILLGIYGTDYILDPENTGGVWDVLLSWVVPALAIIAFWIYKSATPGKMVIKAKIIDEKTGNKPSNAQFIGRYFAYFASIIPLGLGFFWVAFDRKKQGWHDKLSGTVVVREGAERVNDGKNSGIRGVHRESRS